MKLLALLFMILSSAVFAGFSQNITATSNYMWRGYSSSNDGPAIQGGMDFESESGLAVGTWMSYASPDEASNGTEVDFYGSYMHSFTEQFSLGLGVALYHYINNGLYDTPEYSLKSEIFGASLTIDYIEDYFGTDTSSLHVGLSHSFLLKEDKDSQKSLVVSVGHTTFDSEEKADMKNYIDYRIGLENSHSDLTYGIYFSDTNREDFASTKKNDKKLVVSLTHLFE